MGFGKREDAGRCKVRREKGMRGLWPLSKFRLHHFASGEELSTAQFAAKEIGVLRLLLLLSYTFALTTDGWCMLDPMTRKTSSMAQLTHFWRWRWKDLDNWRARRSSKIVQGSTRGDLEWILEWIWLRLMLQRMSPNGDDCDWHYRT